MTCNSPTWYTFMTAAHAQSPHMARKAASRALTAWVSVLTGSDAQTLTGPGRKACSSPLRRRTRPEYTAPRTGGSCRPCPRGWEDLRLAATNPFRAKPLSRSRWTLFFLPVHSVSTPSSGRHTPDPDITRSTNAPWVTDRRGRERFAPFRGPTRP